MPPELVPMASEALPVVAEQSLRRPEFIPMPPELLPIWPELLPMPPELLFNLKYSIMIEINIKSLLLQRGIVHPVTALMKAGIGQGIVNKYLKGKVQRIPIKHIETLCSLLRCTPNDLFKWTPHQPADDNAGNPLQALRPKPSFNLQEKLKAMSLEEIKAKFGEQQ